MKLSKLELTMFIVIGLEVILLAAQAFYHPLQSTTVDMILLITSFIGIGVLLTNKNKTGDA